MGNTVGRLQSFFPPPQCEVIAGSLLGDGRLECRSAGIRGPITARFRVHQGNAQKAFVMWKYHVLKEYVLSSPRRIVREDKQRGHKEASYYFHTRSTIGFGEMFKHFYDENGRKGVPRIISDSRVMTPRALAVWFMDDGSLTRYQATLSTHSFTEDEHHYICDVLRSLFQLKATIVPDRNQMRLRFGSGEREKLLRIIHPFVIPAMNQKVVCPRNDLLSSTS